MSFYLLPRDWVDDEHHPRWDGPADGPPNGFLFFIRKVRVAADNHSPVSGGLAPGGDKTRPENPSVELEISGPWRRESRAGEIYFRKITRLRRGIRLGGDPALRDWEGATTALPLELPVVRSLWRLLLIQNGILRPEKQVLFSVPGVHWLYRAGPAGFIQREDSLARPGYHQALGRFYDWLAGLEKKRARLSEPELEAQLRFLMDGYFPPGGDLPLRLGGGRTSHPAGGTWRELGLALNRQANHRAELEIGGDMLGGFPFELLGAGDPVGPVALRQVVLRRPVREFSGPGEGGLPLPSPRPVMRGNLLIWVNPRGDRLGRAEAEAVALQQRTLERGEDFRGLARIVTDDLSAPDFYRLLGQYSYFYYIGHGLAREGGGVAIPLKDGVLPLDQLHHQNRQPLIFMFSACLEEGARHLAGHSVTPGRVFPGLYQVFPVVPVRDDPDSFCLGFWEELLAGMDFGQSVRRARERFYRAGRPDWALWRACGWAGFRLRGLRHYRDILPG